MDLLKLKITLLAVLLCLTFNVDLKGQALSKAAEMKKAKRAFVSLEYKEAIKQLSSVLTKDTSNVDVQEMLAYSYRMVKDYEAALKWYEKLTQQTIIKPVWALYYAEALANNQHYETSEGWYRKYVSLTPTDKRATTFANTNSGNFNKNVGNYIVNFININTQSAEYAPAFYQGGLIFSSNRPTTDLTKRVYLWDNTPFTNLYVVKNIKEIKTVNPDSLIASQHLQRSAKKIHFNDDDTAPNSNDTENLGNYTSSIRRDTLSALLAGSVKPLMLTGKINTKYHEAAAAVFPDGSLIFTRNNYFNGTTQTSSEGINKLKLYTASGKQLSELTAFPYNSNEFSTGHPTLNQDGTILIFASDRPGGFGGTNMYYCVRSGKGQWTRPVNLGRQINTEGNEMFPFLDSTGSLYFSSTGHAGLGGLDLFEVPLKEMKPVSMPKNMGFPINSSKDDFSLIKSKDGKIGYFSSNRRGSDDIYEFKRAFQLITFQGTLYDANTRIPLANSRLYMRHQDGTDTLITDAKGKYHRELPKETDYEISAVKPGYVSKYGFVTSQGITKDSLIQMDLYLSRTDGQQQFVLKNCDSLKKVFTVKNIYYDLDRAEIRPDATPVLEMLYALMNKHPEMSIITSSHCDSRASEDYNRKLSLRRGAAVKAFLVKKGISANRVSVVYYGKTRLINRCFEGVPCSEEDQQLNRRTEFDVVYKGINLSRLTCDDY